MNRALVAEIQVDGAIKTLYFVLDEKGYFNVTIFEETIDLHAYDLKVISTEAFAKSDKSALSIKDVIHGI